VVKGKKNFVAVVNIKTKEPIQQALTGGYNYLKVRGSTNDKVQLEIWDGSMVKSRYGLPCYCLMNDADLLQVKDRLQCAFRMFRSLAYRVDLFSSARHWV
jgi:hypothetical protein